MAQKEDDLPEFTSPISLPSILYGLHEKKEEDDSKVSYHKNIFAFFGFLSYESMTLITSEQKVAHLLLMLWLDRFTLHIYVV